MPTQQVHETVKVHLILNEQQKRAYHEAIKSYRHNIGGAIFFGMIALISALSLGACTVGVVHAEAWQVVCHLAGCLLILPGTISCIQKARDIKEWLDRLS